MRQNAPLRKFLLALGIQVEASRPSKEDGYYVYHIFCYTAEKNNFFSDERTQSLNASWKLSRNEKIRIHLSKEAATAQTMYQNHKAEENHLRYASAGI